MSVAAVSELQDPLPELLVRRVRVHVNRVKNAIIQNDIIWQEYPEYRTVFEYDDTLEYSRGQLELGNTRIRNLIQEEILNRIDISQSPSRHLITVYTILYNRRNVEWRSRLDQLNGTFVQPFNEDEVPTLVNAMESFMHLTGNYPQVCLRDQQALLQSRVIYRLGERFTPGFIQNELMGNIMGLTPQERQEADMPPQPRDPIQIRLAMNGAILRDRRNNGQRDRQLQAVARHYGGGTMMRAAPVVQQPLMRPYALPPAPRPNDPPLVANGRSVSEPFECAICQEGITPGADGVPLHYRTPCMHPFCLPCIQRWVNTTRNCPSCRADIPRLPPP